MFPDNFALRKEIHLDPSMRDKIRPEGEDVKNIGLALAYLEFLNSSQVSTTPDGNFYAAIERFQIRFGVIAEKVLTNGSGTIANLKRELRTKFYKHGDIYTFTNLSKDTIEIANATIIANEKVKEMQGKGWTYAVNAMLRFLRGNGSDMIIPAEDIRRFSAIQDMEKEALRKFNEFSLSGQTGNYAWNQEIKGIHTKEKGKPVLMRNTDYWEPSRGSGLGGFGKLGHYILTWAKIRDPYFLYVFGSLQIRALCKDVVIVPHATHWDYSVTIDFSLEDTYDFRSTNDLAIKQIFSIYKACTLLEDKGIGKPFKLKSEWTVRYTTNRRSLASRPLLLD